MSFPLTWAATCGDCGERMPEGTEAEYNGDDELVHARCRVPTHVAPRPVCGRCYLELPASGICEECT